ncbi:MAG TPA: dipicolinate synthase subunit DpsA [Firmicutes bacterium]|nr:dipicolinate synthase subunit DpsA [Bacillota bacterium]
MGAFLRDMSILIIGGDKREAELFSYLRKTGAKVSMFGFEKYEYPNEIVAAENLMESIFSAQVIITPLTGIEADGVIYAPYSLEKISLNNLSVLRAFNWGTIVLAGHLDPALKELLISYGAKICETSKLDEISILNAVPTAEGAIQAAMEHTDITIYKSHSFVLGFGRCGRILALTLKALGAEVSVAARRPEVLAWVEAMNLIPVPLGHLAEKISTADIIFNTIPALIIDAEILYRIKSSTLIIDISSFPFGVDFNVAERLNIKAVILPGLPGKVAPKTAGKILAQVYPGLIKKMLKREGKKDGPGGN